MEKILQIFSCNCLCNKNKIKRILTCQLITGLVMLILALVTYPFFDYAIIKIS